MSRLSTALENIQGVEIGVFDTIETGQKTGVLMEIRITYQGVEGSPWMKEYMERQIERLERYISSGSVILIELIHGPIDSTSNLQIQNHKNCFSFESRGGDIFEAFTKSVESACRLMKLEHKRHLKRFHQKLFFTEAIDE